MSLMGLKVAQRRRGIKEVNATFVFKRASFFFFFPFKAIDVKSGA